MGAHFKPTSRKRR